MASITLPLPITPASVTSAVGAVVAAAPAALLTGSDALPLPFAQPLASADASPAPSTPGTDAEGSAMRLDQAQIARQLAYPPTDAAALARGWRAMVRGHSGQLTSRALASSAGQLSPALLAAAAQGQVIRPAEPYLLADAWRFTIHAGGNAPQHLAVLADDPDRQQGRRKRSRSALRLELTLNDDTTVVLQVEPLPQGIAIVIYASDAAGLARLQALQPALAAALDAAGLNVLRWQFQDRLPPGRNHAMVANAEAAAQLLTPAVFRAVAEMALLLPAADAPVGKA